MEVVQLCLVYLLCMSYGLEGKVDKENLSKNRHLPYDMMTTCERFMWTLYEYQNDDDNNKII